MAFSADGKILASADYEKVRLWNADEAKEIGVLAAHDSGINAFASSPDGKISVGELHDFVEKKVFELTDGRQRPTTRRGDIEFDFRGF